MLDYSLCDRTVTIYRRKDGEVQRQEVPGCYYVWQQVQTQDVPGVRQDRKFLLVMPGQEQRIFPGDRVFDGVGPGAEEIDWAGFVPAVVPGLSEAAYVQPWYWDGKICHVEAGR